MPFAQNHNVPSLATIVLKATEIGARMESTQRSQGADLLLNPPVQQFGMTNLKAFDQIVEAGYQYAAEVLEKRDKKTPR